MEAYEPEMNEEQAQLLAAAGHYTHSLCLDCGCLRLDAADAQAHRSLGHDVLDAYAPVLAN